MKKIWYRRILTGLLFMGIIGLAGYGYVAYDAVKKDRSQTEQEVSARSLEENTVLLGGMPVGIYMETEGVMVLGTQSVENQEGVKEEPAKNLVKAGDYIVGINGEKVENKKELAETRHLGPGQSSGTRNDHFFNKRQPFWGAGAWNP